MKNNNPNVMCVNVPYTPEQQTRLKRFCQITGYAVNEFTALALDNQFKTMVSAMDEATKATVRKLLA